jgi:hypothetical protein
MAEVATSHVMSCRLPAVWSFRYSSSHWHDNRVAVKAACRLLQHGSNQNNYGSECGWSMANGSSFPANPANTGTIRKAVTRATAISTALFGPHALGFLVRRSSGAGEPMFYR